MNFTFEPTGAGTLVRTETRIAGHGPGGHPALQPLLAA